MPDFSASLTRGPWLLAQAADEADAAAPRHQRRWTLPKPQPAVCEHDSDDTDTAPPPRRRHGDKPGAENSIRSHSLAMIEKSEKRRRRMVITVLVVLTLVIVGGAVALWLVLQQ